MDIKSLEQQELLNYLLSSDFSEPLTPNEMLYLLKAFKYFYRISAGSNQTLKVEIDGIKRELKNETSLKNEIMLNYQQLLDVEQKKVENLVNRKLTLSERLTGKIKKWN